jgi:hypothetical protein
MLSKARPSGLPLRELIGSITLTMAILSRGVAQTPNPDLCIFSGREQSSLAWESAARSFSGDGLTGHVVRLRDLKPVQSATITLDPGRHFVTSDSGGRFQFAGLPNGRYLLRVRAIGYAQLADSITLGGDGLVVLAAIAQPRGDIGISCPPGSARSRRPPNER